MKMLEEFIQELKKSGVVRLTVRAIPNAPETKILEVMDDLSIRIAIKAPAERGKANEELIKFLVRQFGVAKSGIEILSGSSSRIKVVRVKR